MQNARRVSDLHGDIDAEFGVVGFGAWQVELRGAIGSLKPEEAAVLALLRGRLAKELERSARLSKRTATSKRPQRAA